MANFDTIASELFSQSVSLRGRLSAPYLPLPSSTALNELVETMRKTIFPGFYGESSAHPDALRYKVDSGLKEVNKRLQDLLRLSLCYDCAPESDRGCPSCTDKAPEISYLFLQSMPEIRRHLEADLQAIHDGDPASKNIVEIICCYPGFKAITNYRIAHRLHSLNVPLLPRMITELGHAQTGIDIHPAADIAEGLMIDHGTGVVIGETCVIGRNVKLYQGVTLGARSFPLDEEGIPLKGIPRHPVVEDDVVIYAEATLLGRITIGKGSVIGGNVWLTRSVPPHSRIQQQKPQTLNLGFAEGI